MKDAWKFNSCGKKIISSVKNKLHSFYKDEEERWCNAWKLDLGLSKTRSGNPASVSCVAKRPYKKGKVSKIELRNGRHLDFRVGFNSFGDWDKTTRSAHGASGELKMYVGATHLIASGLAISAMLLL